MIRDFFYLLASLWIIMITVAFLIVDGPDHYRGNLLKEVTVNNETHVIVGYDWWDGTYVMDNGVEYSVGVVKKLLGDEYEE